jgi:hypothetical protein
MYKNLIFLLSLTFLVVKPESNTFNQDEESIRIAKVHDEALFNMYEFLSLKCKKVLDEKKEDVDVILRTKTDESSREAMCRLVVIFFMNNVLEYEQKHIQNQEQIK